MSGTGTRAVSADHADRGTFSDREGFGQKRGYWIYPWKRSEQLIGSVRLWIQRGYIEVSYRERDSQTKWVEQTLLLEGGKRPWFRCPTCNRRAGTLFIVGPPFGCRVCMGLAYQSQRQSPEERIRTRALRSQDVLNGSSEAFNNGRDEDLDIDFDEDFDEYLDQELGEGDIH